MALHSQTSIIDMLPGARSLAARPPSQRRRATLIAYLWILPAIALLAGLLFYPIVYSTVLSFFDWNGINPNAFKTFVGIGNYAKLLDDSFFSIAFRNSILFVSASITVQIAAALLLAIFIFLGEFRGASWLRGIIFFPSVLSAVVIGLVWRNVIFLREGLLDLVTHALGLPPFYPLGDIHLAFYAIMVVAVWQGIGFNLVIFYAGLQSLDREVLESAQIDGANFWRVVYHIITPLQRHIILISVMLNIIGGFQIFDLVFILSKGPMTTAHITDVLATYMVFNSLGGTFFGFGGGRRQMGYAAAIAVVMMIMMLIFAILRARVRKAIED